MSDERDRGRGEREVAGVASGLGRDDLPVEQREALRRAVRLEWATLAVVTVTVAAVYAVSGQSQAMKAAWIEASLSLLPPIAFLVAIRVSRMPPTARFPYGRHRSVGIGHLVAGVALLAMGAFLVVDSGTSLVTRERPPMGVVVIGGQVIWSGWLMIAVMALSVVGPLILGRMKTGPAEALHDKVLYADADMNRAYWKTGLATIVGVLGISLGQSTLLIALLVGGRGGGARGECVDRPGRVVKPARGDRGTRRCATHPVRRHGPAPARVPDRRTAGGRRLGG